MRCSEIFPKINHYLVTLRLPSGSIVKTVIFAETPSQARDMVNTLYGKASVSSVLLRETESIKPNTDPAKARIKQYRDSAKRYKDLAKREQANQQLKKAQQSLSKSSQTIKTTKP